jgi:hypothetical protein
VAWRKVSVSQIDSWLRCQRYWHYRAVGKIYEPESDDQKRGTGIHDDLEVYQDEGTMAGPYAEYVKVAAPFLPSPQSGALTEFEFEYTTYEGGPLFVGFIDLIVPSREPTLALDYKTKKDARYIKTPEDLKTDPQMVSYAHVAFTEGFAKDVVEVAHLNLIVGKKPRAIPPVSTLLTEEYAREAWNARFDVIREMQVASLVEDTQELEPNTKSCGLYNRPCFYIKQCGFDNASELFTFGKRKESPKMSTPTAKPSFTDRLKAAKANGHAAAGAQAAAPIPEVTSPPVPDAVSYAANAAPADETLWINESDIQRQSNGNIVLLREAAAIYADAAGYERPPENSGFHTNLKALEDNGIKIRAAVAIATPVPKKKPIPAAPAPEPVAGVLANDAADRTTPVGTPDPLKAAEAPAEEPKKRGRPKTKAVTEGAASVPAPTDSGTEPETATVEAPKAAPSTPSTKVVKVRPFDLYIDSFPTKRAAKEDVTMFEDWIAPAQAAVAEANGVDDYRLIEYGTGKALLSSEVRARIHNVPPVLVVSSMAVGAHEALLVLIPYATNVTKSMR